MWKLVWPKPDRPDHLLRPWFIDPTESPIQVFGTLVLKNMVSDVRCAPSLVRSCTRMGPIATFGPHMLGLCMVMTTINSIARGMQCVLALPGLYRQFYLNADSDTLRQFYLSCIRPHLEYACTVWDPCLAKERTLLEGVQKFACKVCCKSWSMDYESICWVTWIFQHCNKGGYN